ncbi:MAG: signal peptidase I [Muribaculum sp.]|nr:signal peptidase I [Muribaculum sp.]
MKKKIMRELINSGIYLLCVLAAAWFLVAFVVQRTAVEGSSMEATLSDGDNLFVEKLSYRFGDPQRFDIIVFPYQHEEGVYYIKRIIGLPGETVRIDEKGNIYINDKILQESYGREVIQADHVGRAAEPVTLGDDEYFVMGDNRNNSKDSRTEAVGNVHKKDILGRVWIRIWPLEKFGVVKHG